MYSHYMVQQAMHSFSIFAVNARSVKNCIDQPF